MRKVRQRNEALLVTMNRRGQNVTTLARAAGLNKTRISQVLNCRVDPIQRTRQAIAKALGVPTAKLWPDQEGQP